MSELEHAKKHMEDLQYTLEHNRKQYDYERERLLDIIWKCRCTIVSLKEKEHVSD